MTVVAANDQRFASACATGAIFYRNVLMAGSWHGPLLMAILVPTIGALFHSWPLTVVCVGVAGMLVVLSVRSYHNDRATIEAVVAGSTLFRRTHRSKAAYYAVDLADDVVRIHSTEQTVGVGGWNRYQQMFLETADGESLVLNRDIRNSDELIREVSERVRQSQ